MKKQLYTIALIAAALTLGSCDKGGNEVSVSNYITVSTQIGASSRVATATDGTQSFTEGDKISVYAWTGSNSSVGTLQVNNAINTFDGKSWTATPMMLWKDMVTPHYFVAIYPQRAVTHFEADPFTLNEADQTASDLLSANVLGEGRTAQTSTGGIVPLTFSHLMSKIVINLNFRSQWTSTPTIESLSIRAANTAKVNYLTGVVTPDTYTTLPVVNIPALKTANEGYACSYASVVIPQTIHAIVITINGKTFTYTDTDGLILKQGNIQTLNLIVGRDKIELGSVSINNWSDGTTIKGGEAI